MPSLPPAIFLMGPTASGKTDLAIELARVLPCEIISVDSALVYRGMDIGTAKPEPELLAEFPHRLIDIRDPLEAYSAAEFRSDALAAMAEITAAGRIPLLVGGTMLYYKALLDGLAEMPSADPRVREELELRAQNEGLSALHNELQQIDPESAARIHPNDPQRLVRALEVYRVSGLSMTEHRRLQQQSRQALPWSVVQLAVAPQSRQVLHERIALRFHRMIEQGFLDEVASLRQRGDLHVGLPSIRSVGYRQAWDYFDGKFGKEEMVERGIIATRQLAKRQFTWLRSWEGVCWLDSLACDKLNQALRFLSEDPRRPG